MDWCRFDRGRERFDPGLMADSASVKSPEPARPDGLVVALFLGLHLLGIGLVALLPFLLMTRAETGAGRWVGLALFVAVTGTLGLWLLFWKRSRNIGRLFLPGLAFFVCFCFWKARGLTPADFDRTGPFREVYRDGISYDRHSLARLVPEVDQLKLGSFLFPFVDPYLDGSQARNLRASLIDIYGELRSDPDFKSSSSALGMAYQDLLIARCPGLHFFEYRPENVAEGDCVMIFLHGSLGNFKGYQWVLKETADQLGMTLLSPTFGGGNWQLDKSQSRVRAVVEYCRNDPELASKRLILAGLSNGGRGCLRAWKSFGDQFEGMILISPIMETALIQKEAYKGRPVLILHGNRDRRIPVGVVKKRAALMSRLGGEVTARYWENEDHFLLFTRREEIAGVLVPWIRSIR